MTTTPDADAIELLTTDHREVERLYEQFQAAEGDGQRRQELTNEIIRQLSIHAAIEEEYLYPLTAQAVPGGEVLVDHSIDEHQEVKELLAELDGMRVDDAGFDQRMAEMMAHVTEHVEEEEHELFPRLRESIDSEQLAETGQKMLRGKKTAPTRPHPGAPSRPPGIKAAGPPAAAADRLRDAGRDFPDE